jgi:hypothetical protein
MRSSAKLAFPGDAKELVSTGELGDEAAEEQRVRRLIALWVERAAWRRALREKPAE